MEPLRSYPSINSAAAVSSGLRSPPGRMTGDEVVDVLENVVLRAGKAGEVPAEGIIEGEACDTSSSIVD